MALVALNLKRVDNCKYNKLVFKLMTVTGLAFVAVESEIFKLSRV